MQKEVYVIDIETQSRVTGKGETIPWLGNIIGVGVCWGADFEIESSYYHGEQIDEIFEYLSAHNVPLVAYNTLFEVNWITYHYEHLAFNWVGDAALLAIALDNSANSFGLKDAAPRLVSYEPWEQEISLYCVEHFKCAPSKWGEYIPLLPLDILSIYCRKDTHATYLIWQEGCRKLNIEHIHEFFMAEVFMTSQASLAGTLVNRELAIKLHDRDDAIVKQTDERFMTHPALIPHIEAANRSRYEEKIAKDLAKSKTGKVRPTPYETWIEKHPFITSTAQLARVFKSQKLFWSESKLIHEWPAMTEGFAPCLDADHIHLYGIGGQILSDAAELEYKVNKCKKLIGDSEYDGRAHFDINLINVRSTRVSSAGQEKVSPIDKLTIKAKELIGKEGEVVVLSS